MAREKLNFNLPTLDDMFTTQEERDEAKLKKINEIPIDLIDNFRNHPFKVRDDEDMVALMNSIQEQGVITPTTVRKKEDGRYEMLSGHRRKRACELLGHETIRAEVVEMDRDEAIIFMVDSNLQRSTILPSEKAFSYRMRLNAMKRQAGRPSKNASPVATNLGRADVELGEQVGESKDSVRRYIRLTYLSPPLLKLVDEGKMGIRPAVEISYLTREEQENVIAAIHYEDCTPTHAQARLLRQMSEKGEANQESIYTIMAEQKPNQKERLIIRNDRVKKYFPKNLPVSEREDYLIKALEHYGKYKAKQKEDRDER